MNKIAHASLTDQAMESLLKIAPLKKYSADSPLYYEGQTPVVAYFIVSGNILLIKGRRTYQKLNKGSLLGFQELQLNTPSKYTAMVLNNTEVCYLDKSTLAEIQNSNNNELSQLHSELQNFFVV